nr:hypothetical protein [uncultured Oscillibacter sp.]
MADNVSIVVTMKTDIDAKLKSIASASHGCSKEFEEFQRRATELSGKFEALNTRYEGFNKKSAEAAARAETLKLEMSAMTKAARASGQELDQVSFQKLKKEYREASDSAKGYASAAKDTLKEMKLIEDEVQKMEFKGPKIGSAVYMGDALSKNRYLPFLMELIIFPPAHSKIMA